MRQAPKDESIISHASVFRPVSSFSTSRLNSPVASRGPCATGLHNRSAAGPHCPVRSAQAAKQSHVVCAVRLHKFGPATHQETSRKGSCTRESLCIVRALPIVDYLRLLFATCQALSCSFCPVALPQDGVVMQVEITGRFWPSRTENHLVGRTNLSLCRFFLCPPCLSRFSCNLAALFGGQLAPSRVAP